MEQIDMSNFFFNFSDGQMKFPRILPRYLNLIPADDFFNYKFPDDEFEY